MSNPRPCEVCWLPKSRHTLNTAAYVPAKRTEPLRAVGHAEWKRWLRAYGAYTPRIDNTYRAPRPTQRID